MKTALGLGEALVSSDALAEEVGGALQDRFGWRVELRKPELEVRVQLNQEEQSDLISLQLILTDVCICKYKGCIAEMCDMFHRSPICGLELEKVSVSP